MLMIHDINDLNDLRLFIYKTENTYYFVNAENVYQTILIRLPPVFVQKVEPYIQYLLSEKVNKSIRSLENQASMLLFEDSLISTTQPYLNTRVHSSLQSIMSNTFVEAIVSIDGILKNSENSFEFLYHTIQMREYKIDPPTLDSNLLQNLDLFNLKTINEIDYNDEEWFK